MKVKEIMSTNVESISADSNLVEAANMMARLDIGFLPVVNGDVVGVVTDRDIVVRAIAKGDDPSNTKVETIVSRDVEMLSQDQDVKSAAKLMQDKQIRRILVKGDNNTYVGVVSLGDLATEGKDATLSGKALEKVSQP